MVNKCVASGCKAGYAETKNEIKTETKTETIFFEMD